MKINNVVQRNKLILLFSLLILFFQGQSQEYVELKFNSDKTFKIAQFTDIHFDINSEDCPQTIETIEFVLENEKPDLAILTGDIVTNTPAIEGWKSLAQPFVKAKIPWAVTLGNHDAEPGISRDEIFELLKTFPFFIGEKGPELTGCGNYTLSVKSSEGNKIAANLYCFDSNSYYINKKISDYDWIHFDQIVWYRQQSKRLTTANNGKPVPSLAFFHIPIPEFNQVVGEETTIGDKFEGVASAEVNSGLFASFLDRKDVMGVFVGHDHMNNYIGIHKNIALAFGQVTGADAYGTNERGSRIIQINEGEFSFDTWIRTKQGQSFNYNYPSGMLHDDSNVDYIPSVSVNGLKQGISFKYFEGDFNSTKEIADAKVLKTGILDNISLDPANKNDYFALEYNAFLKIEKKGIYRFYIYSDDGAVLYIDDNVVVDNDGSHSAKLENGSIALDAGLHKFRLLYFESYMGQELEVGMSGLSVLESKIPNNLFFIKTEK